ADSSPARDCAHLDCLERTARRWDNQLDAGARCVLASHVDRFIERRMRREIVEIATLNDDPLFTARNHLHVAHTNIPRLRWIERNLPRRKRSAPVTRPS